MVKLEFVRTFWFNICGKYSVEVQIPFLLFPVSWRTLFPFWDGLSSRGRHLARRDSGLCVSGLPGALRGADHWCVCVSLVLYSLSVGWPWMLMDVSTPTTSSRVNDSVGPPGWVLGVRDGHSKHPAMEWVLLNRVLLNLWSTTVPGLHAGKAHRESPGDEEWRKTECEQVDFPKKFIPCSSLRRSIVIVPGFVPNLGLLHLSMVASSPYLTTASSVISFLFLQRLAPSCLGGSCLHVW